MTLGALQGFSIFFCKKQLMSFYPAVFIEIILLHYLSLAELAKVCVDK